MELSELEMRCLKAQARIEYINLLIKRLDESKKKAQDFLLKHKAKKIDLAPSEKTPDEYTLEFNDLWIIYPSRRGIKVGKKEAFRGFKRMKNVDVKLLRAACWNYARSDEARRGFARDMQRFLKGGYWEAWIKPTEEMLQKGKDAPRDRNKNSKAVEDVVARVSRKNSGTES